jgi:hypothetical protein
MKIIEPDYFGSKDVPDVLVAENILEPEYARIMCDALNKSFNNNLWASARFDVVSDDYELSKGDKR